MARTRPYTLVNLSEAEVLQWRGGETHILVRGEQTGLSYSAFLIALDSGQSRALPAPSEVGYYLLRGRLKLMSDIGSLTIEKGEFVNLPREVAHEVTSTGSDRALFMSLLAPAVEDLWSIENLSAAEETRKSELDQGRTVTASGADAKSLQKVLGCEYDILLSGKQSGDAYAMWKFLIPPAASFPLHSREVSDTGFFVREGSLTVVIEGEKLTLSSGWFLNIPKGVKFAFVNESAEPVYGLTLSAPSGIEDLFAELNSKALIGEASPDGSTPRKVLDSEIEQLKSLAPTYAVDI